jgi:hypothetical protein
LYCRGRAIVSILAGLLALVVAPLAAMAEKRHAFVVGINVYDKLPAHHQLKKAVGDARAMGEALTSLGFAVTPLYDVKRGELVERWSQFLEQVRPGDTVAVVFSGHGIELEGANYLLPRDVPRVRTGRESQLRNESLSFGQMMTDLRERRPRFAFVVLDACRDNPFEEGGKTVGGKRGLVQVEPLEGTFVMFSAGAGQTALDRLSETDAAATSVFTRTLVPLMRQPGLSLLDMADSVGEQVRALASTIGHRQRPAFYSNVDGGRRVCLAGCDVAAAVVKPDQPPAAAEPSPVQIMQVCREVEQITSMRTLEALERRYAGTPIADCISARMGELKATLDVPAPAPTRPAVGAAPKPGDRIRDFGLSRFDDAGSETIGSPVDETESSQRRVPESEQDRYNGKKELTRIFVDARMQGSNAQAGKDCGLSWTLQSKNGELAGEALQRDPNTGFLQTTDRSQLIGQKPKWNGMRVRFDDLEDSDCRLAVPDKSYSLVGGRRGNVDPAGVATLKVEVFPTKPHVTIVVANFSGSQKERRAQGSKSAYPLAEQYDDTVIAFLEQALAKYKSVAHSIEVHGFTAAGSRLLRTVPEASLLDPKAISEQARSLHKQLNALPADYTDTRLAQIADRFSSASAKRNGRHLIVFGRSGFAPQTDPCRDVNFQVEPRQSDDVVAIVDFVSVTNEATTGSRLGDKDYPGVTCASIGNVVHWAFYPESMSEAKGPAARKLMLGRFLDAAIKTGSPTKTAKTKGD